MVDIFLFYHKRVFFFNCPFLTDLCRLSSKMAFFCSYQSETLTAKPPLKKYVFVQYTFGGDEENRTPVRKPIHTTFFVDSLLFRIPVWEREQTRYPVR